jgi:hypothetical protein
MKLTCNKQQCNQLVDKHFVNEKLIQKLDNLASMVKLKTLLSLESIISFFNVWLGKLSLMK